MDINNQQNSFVLDGLEIASLREPADTIGGKVMSSISTMKVPIGYGVRITIDVIKIKNNPKGVIENV